MKTLYLNLILLITLASCNSQNDNSDGSNSPIQSGDWSIPVNEVFDGGPGKDGIPAINNPNFLEANHPNVSNYMQDDDLVVGIKIGNVIKAYPHRILDWHEIVNDVIEGQKISINYCPLTGTAFAWKGVFEDVNTTFGVSGLLYNTNLILYDRQTDSYWAQLKLESVNGKNKGKKPVLMPIFETTWKLWKSHYPNTQILSNVQQVTRNYLVYPYGDYKTNNNFLLFPIKPVNNELPQKERVFALLEGANAKVYKISKFSNGNTFINANNLVVGNQEFITSFELPDSMLQLTFTFNLNNLNQTLFTDSEGNKWSLNGEALEGPRKGQILQQSPSMMSYWFAIAPFYTPIIVN